MLTPINILQKYWGFSSFRPLQEDIIKSVLQGNDTLALLPTGGGKSICFQVPALCKEGICIVVSPLIALMKDQVYHLKEKGIKAAAIFSGMTKTQIDITLDNCVYGDTKFLYVSPERLRTPIFIERVKKMNVNLWAIDEAHCISQWGYDFRPPYLQIAEVRTYHPHTPVLALTATATVDVVKDIQEKLEFKKENLFQKSFLRSNLSYSVLYEDAKYTKLVEILQNVPGSSVVYVRNRRKTKEIADYLKQCKISATYYHAGLKSDERSRKQEDWINGKIRVMVSTNAFGMGIDKPDVRTVIHMDLPDSPEAYFQEAGRAGRDGRKAYAVLLFNQADKHDTLEKIEKTMPSIAEIKSVYHALGNFFQIAEGSGQEKVHYFDIAKFCKRYNKEVLKTYHALKFLEQEEYLFLSEGISQRSKIMVKVNKNDLYGFMIQNIKLEPLIKFLLRSYSGVFDGYTSINEKEMAKKLKAKEPDIIKALTILDKIDIINYENHQEKPFIQFLKPRVDSQTMFLHVKQIQQRINVFNKKINAMLHYATNKNTCRSNMLLAYFGEERKDKCGICDYCLGRYKTEIDQDEYHHIVQLIKEKMGQESYSISYLSAEIPYQNKDKLVKVLQKLVEYNFLIETTNKQFTWNENASYS